jgi:hypothetical protein
MRVVPLEDCDRGCRARQVHVCNEAKVRSEITGKEEWSYVIARCEVCGRVAGRGGCLVSVERT